MVAEGTALYETYVASQRNLDVSSTAYNLVLETEQATLTSDQEKCLSSDQALLCTAKLFYLLLFYLFYSTWHSDYTVTG